MTKINIAQIGVGHDHAFNIMQSLRKQPDIFNVVGFAVTENENLADKNPSAYDGLKQMSADEILSTPNLDAAVIETNEENLTTYALKAAKRGLHIHMDKPGGLSVPEFTELVRTVKQNNGVLSLGYMYRYNPVIQQILEKIRAGKLGEIYSVEAHMSCLHSLEKRKWLSKYPGGMTFYLGCHLIDLIYTILGEPQGVIPFNCAIQEQTGEDFGMVVYKYKNGASFIKTAAVEPGGFTRRQLVICGTLGTVEIKPLESYIGNSMLQTSFSEISFKEASRIGWSARGEVVTSAPFDRYDNMMKSFYQMCIGEKTNDYTPDYELELYKLVMQSCGQ